MSALTRAGQWERAKIAWTVMRRRHGSALKWALFLTIVFFLLTAVFYYFSAQNEKDWVLLFAAQIASSFLATCLWTIVTLFFSARYFKIVNEWEKLEHYPMEANIRSSKHIEISVHGWDGLFYGPGMKSKTGVLVDNWKKSHRAQAWTSFFANRDNSITLILPIVQGESGYNQDLHWANLKVMADRTRKTVAAQQEEIRNTIRVARDLAMHSDQVRIKYAFDLRWIFTMKFDDDRVLISPYTAQHDGPGHFEGPAFEMDPRAYPYLSSWVHGLHLSDSESHTDRGYDELADRQESREDPDASARLN